MSQLLIPEPRIVESTRDSSPKAQADAARVPPGGAKQFTLNQVNPLKLGACAPPLLHPATTSGRRAKFCEKPALERAVDPPYVNGTGKPFWNAVTPSTPQPETTLSITPVASDMYF